MRMSGQPLRSRPVQIAPFGDAYEKIGTIQRRLAWPLHKDDTLFQSGRPTGLNIYFFHVPMNLTTKSGPSHSLGWVLEDNVILRAAHRGVLYLPYNNYYMLHLYAHAHQPGGDCASTTSLDLFEAPCIMSRTKGGGILMSISYSAFY
ncbi:hypothetical protein EDB92DRAFT_1894762 [Lactarius akahatsu]|uniref:Uncharacterized protein n=1 Tax=Lactarius akahatsu TaxID=416441 RepID=A0AAD4L6F8_9AGAM|nr:hypothetical protein EDB92DRAFT_1894762 [Lactarius akahatsu]